MLHPLQVDLWPFDRKSDVRVTCDVAYLCANFSLPRPLCSRPRPDVRDSQSDRRQTSDADHRLMPGAGHNNNNNNKNLKTRNTEAPLWWNSCTERERERGGAERMCAMMSSSWLSVLVDCTSVIWHTPPGSVRVSSTSHCTADNIRDGSHRHTHTHTRARADRQTLKDGRTDRQTSWHSCSTCRGRLYSQTCQLPHSLTHSLTGCIQFTLKHSSLIVTDHCCICDLCHGSA